MTRMTHIAEIFKMKIIIVAGKSSKIKSDKNNFPTRGKEVKAIMFECVCLCRI